MTLARTTGSVVAMTLNRTRRRSRAVGLLVALAAVATSCGGGVGGDEVAFGDKPAPSVTTTPTTTLPCPEEEMASAAYTVETVADLDAHADAVALVRIEALRWELESEVFDARSEGQTATVVVERAGRGVDAGQELEIFLADRSSDPRTDEPPRKRGPELWEPTPGDRAIVGLVGPRRRGDWEMVTLEAFFLLAGDVLDPVLAESRRRCVGPLGLLPLHAEAEGRTPAELLARLS